LFSIYRRSRLLAIYDPPRNPLSGASRAALASTPMSPLPFPFHFHRFKYVVSHCYGRALRDRSGSASLRMIPAAAPFLSNSSCIPAASITRRMAAMLLAMGVLCPRSKSCTVLSDTPARFASSTCDQPNHALAARLCCGLIVPRRPCIIPDVP